MYPLRTIYLVLSVADNRLMEVGFVFLYTKLWNFQIFLNFVKTRILRCAQFV